jgi:hypothetical protein
MTAPFAPGARVIWRDENGNRQSARIVTDDGEVAELDSNDRFGTVVEFTCDLVADPYPTKEGSDA